MSMRKEGHGVSQNILGKQRRLEQRTLISAAHFPFQQAKFLFSTKDLRSCKDAMMSAVISKAHSSTGSQSTWRCREFPWWGLLPTGCKACLILLDYCRYLLKFEWVRADLLVSSSDEPMSVRPKCYLSIQYNLDFR